MQIKIKNAIGMMEWWDIGRLALKEETGPSPRARWQKLSTQLYIHSSSSSFTYLRISPG